MLAASLRQFVKLTVVGNLDVLDVHIYFGHWVLITQRMHSIGSTKPS